ncbi:hypothetical protein V6N13_036659 [Hibiscus sabdariffa]
MDNIVDSLNNAYQEFVAAAANVLETKESSAAQKTVATDAALENFKQKWELFRVACDQAEEFVESIKQRIGSECLVDEATGSMAGKLGQQSTGLPPISAVRLEQMSKAVRWLVIELQHGSGTAGGAAAHAHTSAPFDARFPEDAAHFFPLRFDWLFRFCPSAGSMSPAAPVTLIHDQTLSCEEIVPCWSWVERRDFPYSAVFPFQGGFGWFLLCWVLSWLVFGSVGGGSEILLPAGGLTLCLAKVPPLFRSLSICH